MAVFFEDQVEPIIEEAVNNGDYRKAIELKNSMGISYEALETEFRYQGIWTCHLARMADMELGKDEE